MDNVEIPDCLVGDIHFNEADNDMTEVVFRELAFGRDEHFDITPSPGREALTPLYRTGAGMKRARQGQGK
nr:MAG TPA: hypothetical protein [Caudoviricetes sp.]